MCEDSEKQSHMHLLKTGRKRFLHLIFMFHVGWKLFHNNYQHVRMKTTAPFSRVIIFCMTFSKTFLLDALVY